MYAQLDSYIGPKLLTHLSTLIFFFLASYIPSVNFVVSQNFLFFSQLFHHYCLVLLCLTVQFCAWALQVYG